MQESLKIQQLAENIYSFEIPLPENPLKWLNAYAIKGDDRNLIIDTGFRRPECLQALMAGMEALALRGENTDVFLTHLHSDHTGNAAELARCGCRIFMSRVDRQIMTENNNAWREHRVLAEGMPPEVLRIVRENNPALLYAPGAFSCTMVEDGDVLRYGPYSFRCMQTPGHTPGHMCLYEPEEKIAFLGDHVLFDISPNINFWKNRPDSLGDYLDNLRSFAQLEIRLALPAHRTQGAVSARERGFQLLDHHERRLEEILECCRGSQGLTAYEIAGRISWVIRARNWEEFPPGQKWFAMGETLAHLDHLVLLGKLNRVTCPDGIVRYYL